MVVFRHGARAPLSTRLGSGDVEWSGCERPMRELAVSVRSVEGGRRPTSGVDARQRATALPGGCKLGELTRTGEAQAEALGRALRERYSRLLPELFGHPPLPSEADGVVESISLGPLTLQLPRAQPHHLPPSTVLFVRSTNLQRTIKTAECVVAGLLGSARVRASSSSRSMNIIHRRSHLF